MRFVRISGLVALVLVVSAAGCMVLAGPHKISRAFASHNDTRMHKVFGMHIGGLTLRTAALFSGHGDLVRGVRKVDIGVYELDDDDAVLDGALDLPGWEVVATARERGETAAVLVRIDREEVREIAVLARDGGEMVIVHLRGDVAHILRSAMRHVEEGDFDLPFDDLF